MKKQLISSLIFLLGAWIFMGCGGDSSPTQSTSSTATVDPGSQAKAVLADKESTPNIVQIAINSPDHKTLVKALQAANLVDAVANVGPFTVFAPTDEAFSKLPPGTLDDLMKPENKDKLANILKYHVTTSALSEFMLQDGMTLAMANDGKTTIKREGDKIMINDANVVGSVKASNGMVYVIDKVLLPQQ